MTRSFAWRTLTSLPDGCPSCIEGIGRARVEPSFVPGVIDRMTAASDPESIGAMRALARFLSRPVGGSTGTNLWACKGLVEEMAKAGTGGSVVTLLCDTGDRYADTYYDDRWLAERGIAWRDAESACAAFLGEPDSGAPGLARFVGTRRFISTTGCS